MKDKTITYEINIEDLVNELKEHEHVKIEFYKDGDFIIMDEVAPGYPNETIHTEHMEFYDFEECEDIEEYKDWLNGCFYDGVEIYKNDNYQGKIYVKWI